MSLFFVFLIDIVLNVECANELFLNCFSIKIPEEHVSMTCISKLRILVNV